ncbi:hypothetical protein FQN57_007152 [Myotisia sp. PD_48]|nr:hypothetical protein FQN57_007152 [Myotisia sp. PD_48]
MNDDGTGGFSHTGSSASDFAIAASKLEAVYGITINQARKFTLNEMLDRDDRGPLSISENDPVLFSKFMAKYISSDDVQSSGEPEAKKSKPETGKVRSRMAELWPLVEVVRLRVKASALASGAILVDLPGLLDSNSARATFTKKYLQQCSCLWIISPITRAVDDHTAKPLLGDNFKRQLRLDGSFDKVTFICSKSDDVNFQETASALGILEKKAEVNEFRKTSMKAVRAIQSKIRRLNSKNEKTSQDFDQIVDKIMGLAESTENMKKPGTPQKGLLSGLCQSFKDLRASIGSQHEDNELLNLVAKKTQLRERQDRVQEQIQKLEH